MAAPIERDLDVGAVAAMLDCSAKTVRRLAKIGKLPGYKVGRDWRFTRAAVSVFRRPLPAETYQRPKNRLPARHNSNLPGWDDFDHGGRPS